MSNAVSSDASRFFKNTVKKRNATYVRILWMSCIVRILCLLGYRRWVQQWLAAVLWIDVLAGDAALLLFPGAGLVNAIHADARKSAT